MNLEQKMEYVGILLARMRKYYPTKFDMLFRPKRFKKKEHIYLLLLERKVHILKLLTSEFYNLGRQAAREEAKAKFIADCRAAGWELSNPADIDRFFPTIF